MTDIDQGPTDGSGEGAAGGKAQSSDMRQIEQGLAAERVEAAQGPNWLPCGVLRATGRQRRATKSRPFSPAPRPMTLLSCVHRSGFPNLP